LDYRWVGAADAAGLLNAAEAAGCTGLVKRSYLGINLRNGREPDEALVGASSFEFPGPW